MSWRPSKIEATHGKPAIKPLFGEPFPPVETASYIILVRGVKHGDAYDSIWFTGGKPSAAFSYAVLCLEGEGDRVIHYDPEGFEV